MNDDLTARERRLQTHAGSSEHKWTIQLRFVCVNDRRHHVGDFETNSGNGWSLDGLRPATVERFLDPLPRDSGSEVESIFDFMDDMEAGDPEPLSVESGVDRLERRPVGRSVLCWDIPPPGKGEPRIRWICCHCAQDRQRVAKQDNVLKGGRLAYLVNLMREHGPARLRVELSASGFDAATDAVLRHAERPTVAGE